MSLTEPICVTTVLSAYYINNRIISEDMSWKDFPTNFRSMPLLDVTVSRLTRLCQKFENQNRSELNEMIEKIALSPERAFPLYHGICLGIFEDKIVNVGRFIALFCITGLLAIYCLKNNMPTLVFDLSDWLASFCDGNISEYIGGNYYTFLK